MKWRDLTDAEREALEPGAEGWRWDRKSVLPPGRYVELLREIERYPGGGEVRAIRWGSNGVGAPAMVLLGKSSRTPPAAVDGWYPLPHGAYRGWTPVNPDGASPKLKDRKEAK